METLEYDAGTCKNNFNKISFKKLRKNKTIQTTNFQIIFLALVLRIAYESKREANNV